MTRKAFLLLFPKDSDLGRAAHQWWSRAAKCRHPYGRLWFRHWQQEIRAHPAIAQAFRVAHEQGLVPDLVDNPFDLFLALHAACVQGRVDSKSLGYRAGTLIGAHARDAKLVTMIEVRLVNPDRVSDAAVRSGITDERKWRQRRQPWSSRWVCPEADVTPWIPANAVEIDTIRDRLGLPHWRQSKLKVMIAWEDAAQLRVRIPTVLDGGWAFFRPVPTGYTWGATVVLTTGAEGVREGVIPDDFHDGTPVEHDRRVRVFRIRKEIPDDDRYCELCKQLCRQRTALGRSKRAN